MQSNNTSYFFHDSLQRINDILNNSDSSFPKLDRIPSRDRLTFTNGFYVNCTALFVDLRGSSSLFSKHRKPTVAKIYRTYLSETVAIINSNPNSVEVYIEGDGVVGIFDTPTNKQSDTVLSTAASINSLIKILNCKYKTRNYAHIRAGIGIDYGESLMIKSGLKGVSMNEITWVGDVLNSASKLCNQANRLFVEPILLGENYYTRIKNFRPAYWFKESEDYYGADIVNRQMEEWWNQKCKNNRNSLLNPFLNFLTIPPNHD